MKICILIPSYEKSFGPTRHLDPPYDPTPYLHGHTWEWLALDKNTAAEALKEPAAAGFDVFLNLCDGAAGEDVAGIEVVHTLEALGVAYTGAGPAFYEPTRRQVKDACAAAGVPVPPFAFLSPGDRLRAALGDLCFPLIVKPPNGYASIGLSEASRVETEAELEIQVGQALAAWGEALVEAFVEGREFTVLVAENPDDAAAPVIFTPLEFIFPPGQQFKHFEMKWVQYGQMLSRPCLEAEPGDRLRVAARQAFLALGGRGYARLDFRMSSAGTLYLLDVNPNCGLFYPPGEPGSADLILFNDPAGHRGFLNLILSAALRRNKTTQS